jgi:hypothetical protein
MRLGCLLPVISVALIIGGGQSVYTGLKNRKPTEISIDSLADKKPSAEWLKINGGVLDTMNSSYTSSFGVGEAKSIYVPLVPTRDDSSQGTIHVLVVTKDPALLEFTNELREREKSIGPKGADAEFITKNLDKLKVARTVQGLVKFGIDGNDKETRKIRALYDNLADDALILEEGEAPSTGKGVGLLAAGLVLGGILVASSGRKQAVARGESPPPLPRH